MEGTEIVAGLHALVQDYKLKSTLNEALSEELEETRKELARARKELAEAKENYSPQGLKDGLPRELEKWLFRNAAEIKFDLPSGGGGTVKIKTRRGGKPTFYAIATKDLYKERGLRSCAELASRPEE